MQTKTILQLALIAGAVYFWAIALAHQLQVKVPFLYIYFNVPAYTYQDRIISFLAFGWGCFFFAAYRSLMQNHLLPLKYILLAGTGALIGLVIIQFSTKFKLLDQAIMPSWFWLEIALLFVYLIILVIGYFKIKVHHSNSPA